MLLMAGAALAGAGKLEATLWVGLALFSACHFGLLRRSPRPARLRALLAFAFGLVHGFGFAGVLAEMALPTHRLAPALIGFNLGVELGQLSAVALIWPLLVFLKRQGEGELHRRTDGREQQGFRPVPRPRKFGQDIGFHIVTSEGSQMFVRHRTEGTSERNLR